jgi:hypothetical protein
VSTRLRYARSAGGRIEHLLADGAPVTLCGKDARPMAKWYGSERGQDAVSRPTCGACREAAGRRG